MTQRPDGPADILTRLQVASRNGIAREVCEHAIQEIERLRAELNYQTARATYYEHDGECCGGCTECGRLYEALQSAEQARTR